MAITTNATKLTVGSDAILLVNITDVVDNPTDIENYIFRVELYNRDMVNKRGRATEISDECKYIISYDGTNRTNNIIVDNKLYFIITRYELPVGEVYYSQYEYFSNTDISNENLVSVCYGKLGLSVVSYGSSDDFSENSITISSTAFKGEKGDNYILTDSDKEEISKLFDFSEIKEDIELIIEEHLDNKVDKVEGKDLSSNDFTDLLKSKLEATMSVEDTTVAIQFVQEQLNTLVSGDSSSAIDNFNEIKAFLANFTNTEDLSSILLALKNEIVALIPSLTNYYTKTETDGQLTTLAQTLDLSLTEQLDEKVDKIEGKSLSTNDYTNEDKAKVDATISEATNDGKKYVRSNGEWIEADAKIDLFIDLWNDACGSYGTFNTQTGYFELNGIVDITYSEAILIYNSRINGVANYIYYYNTSIRANMPFQNSWAYAGNLTRIFQFSNSLEVACIASLFTSSNFNVYGSYSFYSCAKLHTVIGVWKITYWSTSYTSLPFRLCPLLENISFCKSSTVAMNMDFTDSPLISTASILYYIKNSTFNSAGETLTLHADSWERVSTDPDIITALEAQPLLTLASA